MEVEEDKIWEAVVLTELDNNKQMRCYKINKPPIQPDEPVPDPEDFFRYRREKDCVQEYCSSSEYYVKIADQQLLVLGCKPVYVSVKFLKEAIAEEYPWHQYRRGEYAAYRSPDDELYADMTWEKFRGLTYKSDCKSSITKGYRFPARTESGHADLIEIINARTPSYVRKQFWTVVRKNSSAVQGSTTFHLMRAYNPELTLKIWRTNAAANDTTKVNGVDFNQVKLAFKNIKEENKDVKTTYEFVQPMQTDIKLYSNPFHHYDTYISVEGLTSYIQAYPDRAYFQPSIPWTDTMNKNEALYKGITGPMTELGKRNNDFDQQGLSFHQETVTLQLSANKMTNAKGKRKKGVKSQGTVMGFSAPKIAAQWFDWTKTPPLDAGCMSIAEWLHLGGFAYGGVEDTGPDPWSSSQNQLNLVFGTAATNSVMLRYETLFQEFFQLERALRRITTNDPECDVRGELQITSNRNLSVQRYDIPANGGNVNPTQTAFNDSEMDDVWQVHPWICYAMEYMMSMNGRSMLLDWDNPIATVEFYPFTRLFYTKGEIMVDLKLLNDAYDEKKRNHLNSQLPPANNWSLKTGNINDSAVESKTRPPNDRTKTNDNVKPLADLMRNTTLGAFEMEDPNAIDMNDPMTQLQLDLVEEEEFVTIDALDQTLNLEDLNFRATMEVPAPIFDSLQQSQIGRKLNMKTQLQSNHANAQALQTSLTVGGIRLGNPKLLIAKDMESFADIPVTIHTVQIGSSGSGMLLQPLPTSSSPIPNNKNDTQLQPQILLLSPRPSLDVRVHGPALSNIAEIKELTRATEANLIGAIKLPEFMLKGDIYQLFGLPGVTAQLFTRQSDRADMPVFEKVTPNLFNNPLGAIFPFIQDSLMTTIPIENLAFIYSEDHTDIIHPTGLRLEADLQFKGALQFVGDILEELFGEGNTPPTGLHFSAHLSSSRNWKTLPAITTITLQGSFDNIDLWIGEIINIRRIGLEVSSTQVSTINRDNWTFGYGFFGTLEIHKIQKEYPLIASYHLKKFGSSYMLGMTLSSKEWVDIFGIRNLTLTNVTFQTSFTTKSIKDSLQVQVSAFMTLADMTLEISGQYSKAESYLQAEIGHLTLADLRNIYAELQGDDISNDLEGNDLEFEHLYLKISSASGVELSGKVIFNGYQSASARIIIGPTGLEISGVVENVKIADVEIESAALDIFIGSGGQANKFTIKGSVVFQGKRVTVGLETSKGVTAGRAEREWMVYGAFDGDLRLSDLCPSLKGDENLDHVLKGAAVIASNTEHDATTTTTHSSNGGSSSLNMLDYPVKKGIQLCAIIEPFPTVSNLTGNQPTGRLVLVLAYDTSGEISASIRLPQSMKISFGETAYLNDLGLSIVIGANPCLKLSAVVNIKMKDQAPMRLRSVINANILEAGGSMRLQTEWKNPFGLSDKVIIKELGIEMQFAYATVSVSGPSKFALDGNIAIAEHSAAAAISVSQRPDEQCLFLKLPKLNIAQLVRFVGEITQNEKLATLTGGGDFLVITRAEMYFSTGATIAEKKYDAGMSAEGAMTLFGRTGQFKASISKSGIVFNGSVSAFKVGPLEVKSASGAPDASIDIAFTVSEQKFNIDGWVTIYNLDIKMLIKISLQPVQLDIDVLIKLTGIFSLQLKAQADNVSDLKNLSDANLTFFATFETDLLDFIYKSVLNILSEIEKHADEVAEAIIDAMNANIAAVAVELKEITEKRQLQEHLLEQLRNTNDEILAREKERQSVAEASLKAYQDDLRSTDAFKVERATQKLQEAQDERDREVAKKREEYDTKLQDERYKLGDLQERQNRLQNEKSTFTIDYENQEGAHTKLGAMDWALQQVKDKIQPVQEEFDRGGFIKKAALAIPLGYLRLQEKELTISLGVLDLLWKGANKGLSKAGLQTLDERLNTVWIDLEHTKDAVKALTDGGVESFIRTVQEDRQGRIEAALREVNVAMKGKRHTIAVIEAAREALENISANRDPFNGNQSLRDLVGDVQAGWITIIADAENKIRTAEEEERLLNIRAREESVTMEAHRLEQRRDELKAGLDLARKRTKELTEKARDLVNRLRDSTFQITKIRVEVNARDLVQGKDMKFTVECVKDGEKSEFNVNWAPLKDASALYKSIADGALKF